MKRLLQLIALLTAPVAFAQSTVCVPSDPCVAITSGSSGISSAGTGVSTAADDTIPVSDGANWAAKAVPNCTDTGGNHLNYTAATNAFSCGTSSSGGGGATTALDNLAAVAVNLSLISDTANTDSLGSLTIPWLGVFMGTTGAVFEGSTADTAETSLVATDPTTDQTITLPNATGAVSVVLCKDATNHATTGTVEESLYTCSIPANTLSANGQSLRINTWWSTAANANAKVTIVKFGATDLCNYSAPSNNQQAWVAAYMWRDGATTQRAVCTSWRGNGQQTFSAATPGETLSGAVTLDVRAITATASGDITLKAVTVELLP